MSGLPASILGLRDRGLLRPGYHADVVLFDPATIADRATFADPPQYAVGVTDVFVNGVDALADGKPTGAATGRGRKGVVEGTGGAGRVDLGCWRISETKTLKKNKTKLYKLLCQ